MDSAEEVFIEPVTDFEREKMTEIKRKRKELNLSPPSSRSSSSSDYITESEEEIANEAYISRNGVILSYISDDCSDNDSDDGSDDDSDDESLKDNLNFCEKCAPNISLRSSVPSSSASGEKKQISIAIAYEDNTLEIQEIHEITGKRDTGRTSSSEEKNDKSGINYIYCINDPHNSASNYTSTISITDIAEKDKFNLEHSWNNIENSISSEKLTEIFDKSSVYIVNLKHTFEENISDDSTKENKTLYSIKNNVEIIQGEDYFNEESESENYDSSVDCSIRTCKDEPDSDKMFEHRDKIKIITNPSVLKVEDSIINSSSANHNISTSSKIERTEAQIAEKCISLKIANVDKGNSTEAVEEPSYLDCNSSMFSNAHLADCDISCKDETFDKEEYSNQNLEEKHILNSDNSETLNSPSALESNGQNNKNLDLNGKCIANNSSNVRDMHDLKEKNNPDFQSPTCQHNNTSFQCCDSMFLISSAPMRKAGNDSKKYQKVPDNKTKSTDLGAINSHISSKDCSSKKEILLDTHSIDNFKNCSQEKKNCLLNSYNHLENDYEENKTDFVSDSVDEFPFEYFFITHIEEYDNNNRKKLKIPKKNREYKSDKYKVANDTERPDKEYVGIDNFKLEKPKDVFNFHICNHSIIEKPTEKANEKENQAEMYVNTVMNKSESTLDNHEKKYFPLADNASPKHFKKCSGAIKRSSSKISKKSKETELVSATQTQTNKGYTIQTADINKFQVSEGLSNALFNSPVSKKTCSVSTVSCSSKPSFESLISASSDINSNKTNAGEYTIKYNKGITQENSSSISNNSKGKGTKKRNSSKINVKSELVSAVQNKASKNEPIQNTDTNKSQVIKGSSNSLCNSSVSNKTTCSVPSMSCSSRASFESSISASSEINSKKPPNRINTGKHINYYNDIVESSSLSCNGIKNSKSKAAKKKYSSKKSVESNPSEIVSAVQSQTSFNSIDTDTDKKFNDGTIKTMAVSKSQIPKRISNSQCNSLVSKKKCSVSSASYSSRPSFESSISSSSDIKLNKTPNKINTEERIKEDKHITQRNSSLTSNDSKTSGAKKRNSKRKNRQKSKQSSFNSAFESQESSFKSTSSTVDKESEHQSVAEMKNQDYPKQSFNSTSEELESSLKSTSATRESKHQSAAEMKNKDYPKQSFNSASEEQKSSFKSTSATMDKESEHQSTAEIKNNKKSMQLPFSSDFESQKSSFKSTSETMDKEFEHQSAAEMKNKNHQKSKPLSFSSAFESQESSFKSTCAAETKESEHLSATEIISHSKSLDASSCYSAINNKCSGLSVSCTFVPTLELSNSLSTVENSKEIQNNKECISIGLIEHDSCIKSISNNINNLVNPVTTLQNKNIGPIDYDVESETGINTVTIRGISGRVSKESQYSEFFSALESQEASFFSACSTVEKESGFTGEYQLFGGLSVSDYFARVMSSPHTNDEELIDISYGNLGYEVNNCRDGASVDISLIADEVFDEPTNISVPDESFAESLGIDCTANFPASKTSWNTITENQLQTKIKPLVRPSQFSSDTTKMLAQTNINGAVKSTSNTPFKEKLCQEMKLSNSKTPTHSNFNLTTPNTIETKRDNFPLSTRGQIVTPRSEIRTTNRIFSTPRSETEVSTSSQKRRNLLSQDKRFYNVRSPVRTYIQNPSPILVTQIKGTQKELSRSTSRKIGLSCEKKKYESSNCPADYREKKVVQKLNYDNNEGETRENKDPNYGRPSLLPVSYRSAPNVFLKDNKDEQKKLPKLNEKFKKMLDTPRPRVIKHEGRAFEPPPEPGSLLSKPQLTIRSSDTFDIELLPQDSDGDISICATKTLFKSNTLSK